MEEDTGRSTDQMDTSLREEPSSLGYQGSKETREKMRGPYDGALGSFTRDIESVESAPQVRLKSMDFRYGKVKGALVEHAFTKILGEENVDNDQ